MAKISGKKLSFPGSGSPDVVGYKIYYTLTGGTLDYDAPFADIGLNLEVNLEDYFGIADGRFDLGVVAVDDAGNESDMSIVLDVPLDFIAPDPPGEISISDS